MRILLKKDGVTIATGVAGSSIKNDDYGINFSVAQVGYFLEITPQNPPEDVINPETEEVIESFEDWVQFPPAGLYTVEAAPEETPVEVELTPEQQRYIMPALTKLAFKLGLVNAGISLDTIEGYIAAIVDPTDRLIAELHWQDASEFKRLHPFVVEFSTAIGLTPTQVDTFWMAAVENAP